MILHTFPPSFHTPDSWDRDASKIRRRVDCKRQMSRPKNECSLQDLAVIHFVLRSRA